MAPICVGAVLASPLWVRLAMDQKLINPGVLLSQTAAASSYLWNCPDCGALNERDLNAALNLEKAGFEFPGQDVEAA